MLFISILVAMLLVGPKTFNLDGDLGRHITIGGYILNNFSIPTLDIFSFTMNGQPLTPHEWLAQVIFALTHQGISLSGPVLVIALLIGFTFSIVYHDSQRCSKMPLLSIVFVIWAAAASSLHWLARPHIFTFFYLALWTYLLEQISQDKKIPVWLFGILMLLWANTHGAFIAGFVVWCAYVGGDLLEAWAQKQWLPAKLKTWIMIGILSFAVTFINPVGAHLWDTSFSFIRNSYLVSHTQEYLPPNFHSPATWPFLALVAFSVMASSISTKRLPFHQALLLTGWTALALYSVRNIPLYAIVAAPILSQMTTHWFETSRWNTMEKNIIQIEQQLHGWLWPVVCTLAASFVLLTPAMQAYNTYDPAVFPVQAMDWLVENPQQGQGFNHFSWGGYMLYRQWPGQLVFIDGQTDFYGEKLTREYEQVVSLSIGWEQVLEKYQINWVLIPTNSALVIALSQLSGWSVGYHDETATIINKGD